MGVTNSRMLMQQNSAEPREGNAAEFLRPFGSKRTKFERRNSAELMKEKAITIALFQFSKFSF